MYVSQLKSTLESLVPPPRSTDDGRTGLCFGRASDVSRVTVRRCLLAVDPTIECIEKAGNIKAHLLITHHPLFTTAVMRARALLFEKVRLLTSNNIWVYCIGDGMNMAADGITDTICHLLQLDDMNPLLVVDASGTEVPVGRTRRLDRPILLRDIVTRVEQNGLGERMRVHGNLDDEVNHVAVVAGEFHSIAGVQRLLELNVDTLLTADLNRESRVILRELNVRILEVTHEAMDFIGMARLRALLAVKHPAVSFDIFDPRDGGTSF